MIRMVGKPHQLHRRKQERCFLGIRHSTWFWIAKWISIAGAGIAAMICAVAELYHAIWGSGK